MKLYASLLGILLLVWGCDSGGKGSYLRGYSGSVGEVIVVVKKSLWQGATGEKIRQVIGQTQYGLPQDEPKFKLIQVSHGSFNRVLNTHRNVVIIDVSDTVQSNAFSFKKNLFAKGQMVVYVKAQNSLIADELIENNEEGILSLFERAELNRLIARNKKFGPKPVNKKVKEKFGLDLYLQKDFELVAEKGNAIWLKLERERPLGGYKHQISQNLLIAELDYRDRIDFLDSIHLVRKDSLNKLMLPGPTPNSYVTTDYEFVTPLSTEIGIADQYAKEIRGLWRMENNFMGGPFLSVQTIHPTKDKILYIEGFVFAPQFDKREYLRELEAVIKSIKPNPSK